MSQTIPTYTELYSISDLHLGGSGADMQMFCQGERLRSFIESIPDKQPAGGQVTLALVLNGDIIDSLPYLTRPGTYIAADGASKLLYDVMNDPAFSPVFNGLRKFISYEHCELIILVGNHDIELALPEAQAELLNYIASVDGKSPPLAAAKGRVRFFTQGTGFRCQVGNKTVFITHGNEADPWNHVDYEALHKAAHARALGRPFDRDAWVPNAGTKLVVDVMNKIKEDHPFIDLLKPETSAAVKVLSVLDPAAVKSLYDALPAFASAVKAHIGPHVVLGAGGRVTEQKPEVVRLLGEAMPKPTSTGSPSSQGLNSRVERFQQENRRPEQLVSDSDSTLGYPSYLWQMLTGKKTPEAKREALRDALKDWIKGDKSFLIEDPDSTYAGIMSQIGTGIDVVITGHTHLPRFINEEGGHLIYMNTGTWARLIGLRDDFLKDETAFKPVYEALSSKEMRTLDSTKINGIPLVLEATLAAHVLATQDGTKARLVRITGSGDTLGEEPIDTTKKSVLEWKQ